MQKEFHYSTSVIAYPILFVLIIWIVHWVEVRFNIDLNSHGIRPRSAKGLLGVFTGPFLHSGLTHLYHNSIPLFVLSAATFYFYRKIAWQVISFGVLLSGILTWIIARTGNHIGASGLIYVLFAFTMFKGIFSKHYRLIALSFMVIFLYGSMLWYVFPVKEQMSWEGHLAGLITGFFFAIVYRKAIARPKRYKWEEPDYEEDDDPFMKHFDENGNFIENLPEEELVEEEPVKNITIRYNFKKKEE